MEFAVIRCVAWALLLSLWLPPTACAQGAVVVTPHVRAELLAHAPEGIRAGNQVWLGLAIDHQPHWHTYWKNAGDAGLPTTFTWSLPAGFAASEILWPAPKRLPLGPLMNYGYEGKLLLPVLLSVPADFNAAVLDVRLRADWLVCKEICLPESGEFVLQLKSAPPAAGPASALFESAPAAMPQSLAVAIASPCSAPFMGAALGAALAMPAPAALSVFAALGLGMAAPYLAASLWPGFARLLPRPGVWMARFKTLMAFPMFATVVWLVWILGQQAGIDGAAALLGELVALAYAAWTFGTPAGDGRGRAGLLVSGAVVLAAAAAWAWPALNAEADIGSDVRAEYSAGTALAAAPRSLDRWQPWSAQAVDEARRDGRPVFIDVTAAWCEAAPTAIVMDSGKIARAYGVKTTPHMYLIDPAGKLVYAGAIDSKPSANPADIASATKYVTQAIDEVTAGKPVSKPVTQPYGCSIKYPS